MPSDKIGYIKPETRKYDPLKIVKGPSSSSSECSLYYTSLYYVSLYYVSLYYVSLYYTYYY
jgi:hypothetical protein